MANTYTQLYLQVVFAVKGRQSLIREINREQLEKFITGIVQKRNHKMLSIYAMPDHVHLLIGIKPDQSISDLVRDVKAGSSKYINDSKWTNGRFSWQEGYGAFTYSRSQIDKVVKYILNQEEHHKVKTFREEYIAFLDKFQVEYYSKYLFDWIE
jgi:putative transposase